MCCSTGAAGESLRSFFKRAPPCRSGSAGFCGGPGASLMGRAIMLSSISTGLDVGIGGREPQDCGRTGSLGGSGGAY